MKVIINTRTSICKYILPDEVEIILEENYLQFDNTIVTDMNVNNCYVLENQTPPDSRGALLKYSPEKGYQLYFEYGEKTIAEIKDCLKEQVSDIATEISILVNKIRLIHDPQPVELAQLINFARLVYNTAHADIDALTEENIYQWRLRSPELAQLMASFKTFLNQ